MAADECPEGPFAVAVTSVTNGIPSWIHTLSTGEGGDVIVPSFAFVAEANATRLG